MTATLPTETGLSSDLVVRVSNLAIDYETRYGDVSAVREVSFDLRRGETLALVGESGCGKTTVAYGLIGFLGKNGKVTSGSIEFLGRDITGLSEKQLRAIRGKNVSMVYQDPMSALNPSMRIGKQLTEILTEHNEISREEAFKRCVAMLEQVRMPDARGMMDRYTHQLSGGQQQRVIIAGGLLNNPALLIMDEPTTALDVTIEATILDLVDAIKNDFNTAVLFITHDLGVVARIADRVAVMYAGEIVEEAPVDEIFHAPRHPYTRGLLVAIPRSGVSKKDAALEPIVGVVPSPAALPPGCLFEPRCPYGDDRSRDEHPDFRRLTDTHAVRCHHAEAIASGTKSLDASKKPPPPPVLELTGESILEVDDLRTYYAHRGRSAAGIFGFDKKYVKAADHVNLSLRAGETLGLVGESGSGKSTVAKTILGLEPLTGGRIEFVGLDLAGGVGSRSRKTLKLLQMVFQNPDSTLNPSVTVGAAIGRSVLKLTDTPRSDVRGRVIELLDSVKLGQRYYDRLPRQLSGGEKQRVALARALAGNPDLIVADEPTSALDVSVQAAVLNLLLEIQAKNRTAFILISHDLSVVRYLADTIAVMYLGRIVEYGPASAFFDPPYHPYTEALLSAVPLPDPSVEPKKVRLSGNIPSALDPPEGCVFHTRCPHYIGDICHTDPPLRQLGDRHVVLCHHEPGYLAALEPVLDAQEAAR
ncbi:MAG: dipeptide ABC transporter ATP-binding protein [Gaiellaceae bacterium]